MRRLVVAMFISLDGVMQAPGGPDEDRDGGFEHGGWMVPFVDDMAARGDEDIAELAALLLGSQDLRGVRRELAVGG